MKTLAFIRPDINPTDGIPVGTGHIYDRTAKYECKWSEDEETFFIKVDGVWQEAQSIDFDFTNNPKLKTT
jgi:hypothetical protein